jgi:hypothetical protein
MIMGANENESRPVALLSSINVVRGWQTHRDLIQHPDQTHPGASAQQPHPGLIRVCLVGRPRTMNARGTKPSSGKRTLKGARAQRSGGSSSGGNERRQPLLPSDDGEDDDDGGWQPGSPEPSRPASPDLQPAERTAPSMEEWLLEQGVAKSGIAPFVKQGFDSIESLVSARLTQADLREMGVEQMRVRKQIYHALPELRRGGAKGQQNTSQASGWQMHDKDDQSYWINPPTDADGNIITVDISLNIDILHSVSTVENCAYLLRRIRMPNKSHNLRLIMSLNSALCIHTGAVTSSFPSPSTGRTFGSSVGLKTRRMICRTGCGGRTWSSRGRWVK